MTTLTVGNFAFDATNPDLRLLSAGTVTFHSATTVVVDYGDGFIDTFTGLDFDDFDGAGIPASGTLTGLSRTYLGDAVFTISGLVDVNIGAYTSQLAGGHQNGVIQDFFSYDDTRTGGNQNDHLYGHWRNDTLRGGLGNDILDGGTDLDDHDVADYSDATGGGVSVSLAVAGAQAVGGGLGSDTLIGIEGLIGSAFGDTLTGSSANNTLEGGSGDDSLNGGNGIDTALYSGASGGISLDLAVVGAQAIGGGQGSDTLTSIENISASNFADDVSGNSAANELRGLAGNDTLSGDDGNDTLIGDAGDDNLDGEGGSDIASYRFAASGVAVDLAIAGPQNVGGGEGSDTFTAIEGLEGSSFNDTLRGTIAADTLLSGDGNDTLVGRAGNDVLDGGFGQDTIDYALATSAVTVNLSAFTITQPIGGGQGDDEIRNVENIIGSTFNDTLTGNSSANELLGGQGDDVLSGRSGTNILNGGDGIDTASYATMTTAWVDLLTGLATLPSSSTSETLIGIENLLGGSSDDRLSGDNGDNVLSGAGANDFLRGRGGNDLLEGGSGDDSADYTDASAGVTVDLRLSSQSVLASEGTDTYSSIESIAGSLFADHLTGTDADNQFRANDGDDTIIALGGSDGVFAQGGNDIVAGGEGDDQLHGGEGNDALLAASASTTCTAMKETIFFTPSTMTTF